MPNTRLGANRWVPDIRPDKITQFEDGEDQCKSVEVHPILNKILDGLAYFKTHAKAVIMDRSSGKTVYEEIEELKKRADAKPVSFEVTANTDKTVTVVQGINQCVYDPITRRVQMLVALQTTDQTSGIVGNVSYAWCTVPEEYRPTQAIRGIGAMYNVDSNRWDSGPALAELKTNGEITQTSTNTVHLKRFQIYFSYYI